MNIDALMSIERDQLRSYVWEYFKLHADQRIKAFHFFVTMQTALLAGIFLIITNEGDYHKYSSIIGFFIALLSFVFWKLDHRTRMLIKMAENSLRFIEDHYGFPDMDAQPHLLRLIARSEVELSQTKSFPLISGTLTYSKCFGTVFLTFGLFGVAYAIWTLIIFC